MNKMIDPSDSPNILRAVSPFVLPTLPYAEIALGPVISAKTITFHYGT
jgi:Fe-Mn family superoxide dismutase